MFFPELEAIALEHPDLRNPIQHLDELLVGIVLPSPLRPEHFASLLGEDLNRVSAAFNLFAQHGILCTEEMVECESCHNLMSWADYLQANQDEDGFECSFCGLDFPSRVNPIIIFRMTPEILSLPRPTLSVNEIPDALDEETLVENQPYPIVDGSTFTIRGNGKSCELHNTKEFVLFERLHRRPGHYFSITTLIEDVWGDALTEKNTVQKTVSSLRQKLREAAFDDIEIDGTTNRGHYSLIIANR